MSLNVYSCFLHKMDWKNLFYVHNNILNDLAESEEDAKRPHKQLLWLKNCFAFANEIFFKKYRTKRNNRTKYRQAAKCLTSFFSRTGVITKGSISLLLWEKPSKNSKLIKWQWKSNPLISKCKKMRCRKANEGQTQNKNPRKENREPKYYIKGYCMKRSSAKVMIQAKFPERKI